MNRALLLEFVKAKHAGQIRKNSGLPYHTHLEAVAAITLRDGEEFDADIIYAAALLHDTLEDTKARSNEIIEVLMNAGLSNPHISYVLNAVLKLTTIKGPHFNIIRYLSEIKRSRIATLIKLSDLEHNMSDLAPGNLLDKYRLCRWFLEN
jgi:(p)ppGpp synthase/HD superfamily hydrolase